PRIKVMSSDDRPKLDVVLDRDRGLASLLIADRRQYALLDLDTLGKHAAGNASTPAIAYTGQKRTIAGRSCEVWRIAGENGAVQACVATGAPPFDLGAVESAIGYKTPGWLRAIVAEGGIPLRVEMMDGSGPTCVTELIPKPLADTSFTVPQSYAKIAP